MVRGLDKSSPLLQTVRSHQRMDKHTPPSRRVKPDPFGYRDDSRQPRQGKRGPAYAWRCMRCLIKREPDELFWGALCPACRAESDTKRRRRQASRLLGKATLSGTETRDGKQFVVIRLPDKKRHHVR